MSFLLGMNNFQLRRALNHNHDILCSRPLFLKYFDTAKSGEKKVDASYLNDEVMFLLADSFSLGAVLFEINEALSVTGYNQVYKSLFSAISQSQMGGLIRVLILIHIFLSRLCVLHENGSQTSN